MRGVVITPRVSSCWMLVPGKETWWVYEDVGVSEGGLSWYVRDREGEGDVGVDVDARCRRGRDGRGRDA
jgi:hypothetical protein